MTTKIEEVILIAAREGTYTVYVFQNIETKAYIMCTRLPDWRVPSININDTGFLEYQIVQAGDEYFDINTQKFIKYNYSNVYFINFIQKQEILLNNEIIL